MDEILRQLEGMFAQATEAARAEGHAAGVEEGRVAAFDEVRNVCDTATGSVPRRPYTVPRVTRSTAPVRTQSGRPRRNPWLTMTPREREDRVKRMLAGRGLKPKK